MSEPTNDPTAILTSADFPEPVLKVVSVLQGAGHKAYLVGGSVRDLLLGKHAKDFDVATSARAGAVVKLFRRTVPTGIKHGTVTVLQGGMSVEVTTFRGEGAYQDGRRPESVVFLDEIGDDLARRDFTINAMAYDPLSHQFVDPFGGAKDIEGKLVRCVGDPGARFSEDGLRPMRAVRFASVLGFRIDPATLEAISETLETFALVSMERVRDELLKILGGPGPARGLDLLRQTGLLTRAFPELSSLASSDVEFAHACAHVQALEPDVEVRLAALLEGVTPDTSDTAATLLDRLRLPRRTIDAVLGLVAERAFSSQGFESEVDVRRAASRVGPARVAPLLRIARARAIARGDRGEERGVEALQERFDAVLAARPPLRLADLALDGRQVMEVLGEGQGPKVGEAMRFLLEQVLRDPGLNEPKALRRVLEGWCGQ